MAIFLALKSPEVEVIGLSTIYGNVYTTLATKNALHLVPIFVNFLFIISRSSYWFSAIVKCILIRDQGSAFESEQRDNY